MISVSRPPLRLRNANARPTRPPASYRPWFRRQEENLRPEALGEQSSALRKAEAVSDVVLEELRALAAGVFVMRRTKDFTRLPLQSSGRARGSG